MKTTFIENVPGRHAGALALLIALIVMAGCGGVTSNGTTSKGGLGGNAPGDGTSTATVQVRFGDNVPVEKIVSYELAVSQVTLTSAGSATTDLLSAPMVIEQSSLASTTKPIASATVMADTYTKATVALGSSKIVFVDNLGQTHEQSFAPVSPVEVPFSPAITVGSENSILTVSLDLRQTVTLDTVNGVASLNAPVFSFASRSIAAGTQTPETGSFQCVYGKVTSVASPNFTVSDALTGVSLNFTTNGSTVIENATLGSVQNMLVEVEGHTLSDGSLMADEVEAFQSSSGVLVAGVVAGYSNTGMTVTTQEALSDGLASSKLGTVVNIDLSQPPAYSTDTAGMDMTGLEYLTFDENSIIPGQSVTFTSHTGLLPDDADGTAGLLTADTVELEPQTLSGTVTNYLPGEPGVPATFDLELPPQGTSMLSVLGPGATSVPVVVQSLADLSQLPSALSEGMTVQVRGLLFYTANSGSVAPGLGTQDYKLVAQRIVQ